MKKKSKRLSNGLGLAFPLIEALINKGFQHDRGTDRFRLHPCPFHGMFLSHRERKYWTQPAMRARLRHSLLRGRLILSPDDPVVSAPTDLAQPVTSLLIQEPRETDDHFLLPEKGRCEDIPGGYITQGGPHSGQGLFLDASDWKPRLFFWALATLSTLLKFLKN